jgi:hypothetical protein
MLLIQDVFKVLFYLVKVDMVIGLQFISNILSIPHYLMLVEDYILSFLTDPTRFVKS